MQDGDSFAGGTYPTPPETEERHIKVNVVVEYEAEYDIPKNWTKEDIEQDIKDNFMYITWDKEDIVEIEVS